MTHQDSPSPPRLPDIAPKEFCARNRTSVTTFYQLLKEGRLKAIKRGRLTFVTPEEEERYRASLPAYEPRSR